MSKLISGKMNLSAIDKSLLIKGKNGIWLNWNLWVNDEPDQFGNDASMQQKTEKGAAKIFLGNGKTYNPESKVENKAVEAKVFSDDLPF